MRRELPIFLRGARTAPIYTFALMLTILLFGVVSAAGGQDLVEGSALSTPATPIAGYPVIPSASECAGPAQEKRELFGTVETLLQTATSVPTETPSSQYGPSTPDASIIAAQDAAFAQLREQLASGTYSVRPEHEPALAVIRLLVACYNASDLAAAATFYAPELLLRDLFPSQSRTDFVDQWTYIETLTAQVQLADYPWQTEILSVLAVLGPTGNTVTVFQVERETRVDLAEPTQVVRYVLRTDGNRWMIVEHGALCAYDPVNICAGEETETP